MLTAAQPVPTTDEDFELYMVDEDQALASYNRVFMVVWRKRTTLKGTINLQRYCHEFGRSMRNGIGLLTVIEQGASSPDSDARKAVAEFLKQGSDYIKVSAVVVEGSGFRASAVRGVVTGLTMLARQAFPHRVVAIEEAASMYNEHLGELPQSFLRAFDRVRSEIDAR